MRCLPIYFWPMIGKENFFYTRHPNNNDRWVKHISEYKKYVYYLRFFKANHEFLIYFIQIAQKGKDKMFNLINFALILSLNLKVSFVTFILFIKNVLYDSFFYLCYGFELYIYCK